MHMLKQQGKSCELLSSRLDKLKSLITGDGHFYTVIEMEMPVKWSHAPVSSKSQEKYAFSDNS